ncbi:uncharacterized protein LOC113360402 [Papaver somniferum]|uniref:uncharacterized protein LOC113360402 n=1 Tax=Papaver somniferum TaxID=3469 RepID=UPI000E6FF2C9|nr:uncharacterized protein LOC113360402 [Papaver somniferum]
MDSSVVDLNNSYKESPSIDLTSDTDNQCLAWRFSLIRILDLLHLKFVDVVLNLKSPWKLEGQCKMIPLGKRFFTIKLDNERDRNMIKEGRWELFNQVLWIRNWIPDFRPENHRTSLANVWVHLPGLSLEYWEEKTFFTIGRALGEPVKIDDATLNYETGYYARMLISIDFAKKVPNILWIKTKNGGFMQYVLLIKPPKFCQHCKIVGHLLLECNFKNNQSNIEGANKGGEQVKNPVQEVVQQRAQNQSTSHKQSPSQGSNPRQSSSSQKHYVQEPFDICESPIIQILQNTGHKVTSGIPITKGMFSSLQEEEVQQNNF